MSSAFRAEGLSRLIMCLVIEMSVRRFVRADVTATNPAAAAAPY